MIYGQKSAALCAKLVKEAELLCKRFMHQIQRQLKKEQERQLKRKEGSLQQDSLQSNSKSKGNYSFSKNGYSNRAHAAISNIIASGTYIKKGKSSRSSMNSMEREQEHLGTTSKRSYSSHSEKLKKSVKGVELDRSQDSIGRP